MAWSITPTDATIDSNGKATITSRGTSNKVYTITYTDTNGCTASATYTLKGYNCDDDVHINSTIPTLSSAGTSVQIGTYTREAHDYISFTPTYNWLHLTAETNGNISMYADTNTDPERSTSVEVSINGSGCTTFNVTQEAGEQPCTCDDFSASTYSLSFGAGADSSTVMFSKTRDCTGSLTSLTPSTNDSWITPTFNSSHDTLTISVSANADTTTSRTGHTVVSYGDCDVVNITVEQSQATPVACTCDDFRVGSSPAAIPATGGSATVTWKFTGSCTSILVTPGVPSTATSWCHVTTGNGVFNITVDNYPYSGGVTDRSTTIISLLGESRSGCSSGEFTVTQLAPEPECSCDEFTLTGATNITSSSQSTVVIGTYTLPSCTGSITNYTSDVGWVSALSCINGTVYGNVKENTSTSSRSGTLSLEWTGGGLTCNKTATFTQGGNPNCESSTRRYTVDVTGLDKLQDGMPFSVNSDGQFFYVGYYDNSNCDAVGEQRYDSQFDFSTQVSNHHIINIEVGSAGLLGAYNTNDSIEYTASTTLLIDDSKATEITVNDHPSRLKMYWGYGSSSTPGDYGHELVLPLEEWNASGESAEFVYKASNGVKCTITITLGALYTYHSFDFENLNILSD